MSEVLSTAYAEYAIAWIEAYCVHTIGPLSGEPLTLAEWQKEFIREAFLMRWDAERGEWRFLYQTLLLMIPRGAGKSTLAAALSLFKLSPASGERSPRVLLSAATKENVEHVFGPARAMVDRPGLFDFMEGSKNKIWCTENGGELHRLSGDGKGQFGHIPSFVVRDELHQWVTDKQVQLSEALQTALAKRPNSQSLTVTTAGYDKEQILGLLYDAALKNPLLEQVRPGLRVVRDRGRRFLFWCFEAPPDAPFDEPETWRMAQPADWIDEDAIQAQLDDPSIGVDEFQRQWLNRWTAAAQAWLPVGLWRSLARPDLDIPAGSRVQAAVDAAITRDSTALAWAWQPSADHQVVVRCHVWSANEDTARDWAGHPDFTFVPGGRMDLHLVQERLEWLVDPEGGGLRVSEVVYDPRFFEGAASDISAAGFRVGPFQQNSPQMADALNSFFVGCGEGTIAHGGSEILAAHVEATAGVQTERGWKVFKLKQTKKIDGCVAVVMAQSRARLFCKNQSTKFVH